jgi:hypothetical protein
MMEQERTRRINDKKTKWKATGDHNNDIKEKNKRKKVEEQGSHLLLFMCVC